MTAVLIHIEAAPHRLRKISQRASAHSRLARAASSSIIHRRYANDWPNGELDVALVSSFEFLRNPIYRIVDDVSISSDGPVYSVVVAHRG